MKPSQERWLGQLRANKTCYVSKGNGYPTEFLVNDDVGR